MSGSETRTPASRHSRLWRGALVLLLLSVCICLAGLVYLSLPLAGRANHISYDVRSLWVLGGLALLAGSVGLFRRQGRLSTAVCCVGLALCLLVAVLDHCNLLVQYDRWCDRGMPDRGVISK